MTQTLVLAQNAPPQAAAGQPSTGQVAAPPRDVGQPHEPGFWVNPETWVTIAFIIFIVLFGRRLWAALAGMLDRRAAAVRAELAEAARLRQEAEAMLADARVRREQALSDARKLLDGAKAEADRLSTAAAAETEANARRRERMALERIAAAEKAAVTEVRAAAIDVATQAAERLIRSTLGEQDDARLIDLAISGLPAALVSRA